MQRVLYLFLTGLLLWTGSLCVRRAVLGQQTLTVSGEAPFLLESALQFRMTRMVAEGRGLPRVEPSVQYPEGVETRKTYSIGAEYVYSFFAHRLPSDWSLESRVRWVSAGLFCLTIPLAALWSGLLYRSGWAGWMTGCLLAVSPAFVVRSSGLELSRENLAFPFIAAFLLFELLSTRSDKTRRRWIHAGIAALCLAMAQVFWDMSQYMIGLWIVKEWVRVVRPGTLKSTAKGPADRSFPVTLCVGAALLLAALANPYLRSKGFIFSPVLTLVLVRIFYALTEGRISERTRWLACALLFVLWQLLGGWFVVNYSHFGELLWAKIRFLNVKPADPARLTYLQRIMWTPALNSSTGALTKAYFPVTLWALLAAIPLLQRAKRRAEGVDDTGLFFALITFPLYILFFRFHVFLILFAAGCIGGALATLPRRFRARSRFLVPLFFLVFLTGVETYHLLFFEPAEAKALRAEHEQKLQALKKMGFEVPEFTGNRWGRPGPGYDYIRQLTEELRTLEPGPVLAGFGISGSILADVGLPILLHPKFETPGIRERVRQFYEHLFLKSEKEFRDWVTARVPEGDPPKAMYYVHGMGSLAGGDTRESPRYMVDALSPPASAAVHLLENHPRDAVWFRPVGGNAKFRIFRIITREDERVADELTAQARRAWERGDEGSARRSARRALEYHWKHADAQQILSRLNWVP